MNSYIERTDAFINSLGLDSYRVGGSVRDELLERRCKDADYMIRGISLSDLGRDLRRREWTCKLDVSPLKLRDGRQAGWRVYGKGLGSIEIVLPRTEVSTGPGHRDFMIIVDPNLSLDEDARRRDFTFNALYREVATGEIHDPTQAGLFDLERSYVRTTHVDSFRDDPLRTLRALRFVSVLGYDLSMGTLSQMRDHADAVDGLTAKGTSGTVLDELSKLLMGNHAARALRIARDTGVLARLLPELEPMLWFDQGSRYHDMTTDEHTFTALEHAAHVDAPLRVRMALLFHDSGKPETAWLGKDGRKHYYSPSDKDWAASLLADGAIHQSSTDLPPKPGDHEVVGARIWMQAAQRLNVDKALRGDVEKLILNHMVSLSSPTRQKVNRARVKFGDELLHDLYLHRACDAAGKGPGAVDKKHFAALAKMEKFRQEAVKAEVPASVKDLQITGKDVMAHGLRGAAIGKVLHAVLDEVVVDPTELKLSRDWQVTALLRH
jgi:tRNA nucleotidyltransferase (CCA-adding enzyme)